jgi:hypothetical protein
MMHPPQALTDVIQSGAKGGSMMSPPQTLTDVILSEATKGRVVEGPASYRITHERRCHLPAAGPKDAVHPLLRISRRLRKRHSRSSRIKHNQHRRLISRDPAMNNVHRLRNHLSCGEVLLRPVF